VQTCTHVRVHAHAHAIYDLPLLNKLGENMSLIKWILIGVGFLVLFHVSKILSLLILAGYIIYKLTGRIRNNIEDKKGFKRKLKITTKINENFSNKNKMIHVVENSEDKYISIGIGKWLKPSKYILSSSKAFQDIVNDLSLFSSETGTDLFLIANLRSLMKEPEIILAPVCKELSLTSAAKKLNAIDDAIASYLAVKGYAFKKKKPNKSEDVVAIASNSSI